MISLVVPSYNERGNIKSLVERAGEALGRSGEPYELIIVDDNSPDGTAEEVRQLQSGRPWLRLVVRTRERGLSTAVMAGWAAARGELLACMDADLQHPPEMLSELYRVLRSSGADIVVASRHVRGGGVSDWSLTRRSVSWTATLLAGLAVPGTLGEVRDPMSGFFLLRREVIQGVRLRPRGYKILLEVLAKGNYKSVKEAPYVFEERAEGGSKIGREAIWDYLAHLGRISIETGEAARAAKFMSVGLSGGVVNLFFYRVFAGSLGWRVWQAAAASAAIAIINNFIWNERFTFAEIREDSPDPAARRLLMFTLISVAGLILNAGLVEFFVSFLRWHWIPGVLAGVVVAGGWNFFANSNLTWRGKRNKRALAKAAVALDPAVSKPESVGRD
jgi:dolichol-phosphate mannosyltransferase